MAVGLSAFALLPAAAEAEPTSTEHGVNRDKLAKQAERVVEKKRGIDVIKISRCSPSKRKGKLDYSKWICYWRAEGRWPGDVPYHCAGDARWKRKGNRWIVDRCNNRMQPMAPLLDVPNPHPTFGYNDDWIFEDPRAFDMAAETGSQVARTGVSWAGVEPERGAYNWWSLDRMYERLLERGQRPLWALMVAPCWAQGDPGRCDTAHPAPRHYDAYADFAVKVAQRYPQSAGIEVWNEPNYPRFWGGWPDAELYSKMLKQTADAIHAQAPGMPVVSGGLSPHADSDRNAIGFSNFLDAMYRHGGAQAADAIGIHPYPGVGPSQDYIGDVRVYLGKVQRVLAKHGDSATPLWATEFGVSTTGPHAFDAGHQARAIIELYELFRRVHKIDLAIVHRFVEDPGLAGREAGFGVVSENFVPKPAYCALAAVRSARAGAC